MDHVTQQHFAIRGLSFSPIKGPEGNIEYLIYIEKYPEDTALPDPVGDPADVTDQAHASL